VVNEIAAKLTDPPPWSNATVQSAINSTLADVASPIL
jgi:hypothetical protein